MSSQYKAGEYPQSMHTGANPNLPPGYDNGPEILHIPDSGIPYNQKEPDENGGLEAPKGTIWGMKRKVFMIVSGVFIILVIAVAAGVGGGVAAAAAKSENDDAEATSIPTNIPGRISELTSPTSASTTPTPTPTPILKDSPLAAVNWGTSIIHLFYKDTDYAVRHLYYDGSKWGRPSDPIFKPREDSGLTAIGWIEDSSVRQVRVYTVSGDNILMECLWDSSTTKWTTQTVGEKLEPPGAGSHLTAYTWFAEKALQVRVYYQGQDGYLREAAFIGGPGGPGWTKGGAPKIESFPLAKSGTGLAVVPFPDRHKDEAKLYYQSLDGKLVSYDYKPEPLWEQSWQNQSIFVDHGYVPDRARLAAVINQSINLTLRIYFTQDGQLKETWWESQGGWRQSGTIFAAAAQGVAAISSGEDIQVFFQHKRESISSMTLDRKTNKWVFGGVS